MCGIVGFIARPDTGPNLFRLRKVILANEVRGDDAHGMAWIDANGRVQMYKRPGSFKDNLHVLSMAVDARAIICHMRKTTQGTEHNNINNHPHICDNGFFVHNGMIRNYNELLNKWGVMPSSECDTEVLGLITTKVNRPPINQWQSALNEIDPMERAAIMALYAKPTRLIVARRGNPLQWWKSTEGFYFASLGTGFPHRGKEFRDNQVVEYSWTRQSGGNRIRGAGLRPYAPAKYSSYGSYTGSYSSRSQWIGTGSKGYCGSSLTDQERALLEAEYGSSEVADHFARTLQRAGSTRTALPVHYQDKGKDKGVAEDYRYVNMARRAVRRGQLMEEARKAASGKKEGDRVLVTPPPQPPVEKTIVRGDFDANGNLVVVSDEKADAAVFDEIDYQICPRCESIIHREKGADVCDCPRDLMEMDSDPGLFDDDPPDFNIELVDPAELDRIAGG